MENLKRTTWFGAVPEDHDAETPDGAPPRYRPDPEPERAWTRAEQVVLLDVYANGADIDDIEERLGFDRRDVAVRLVRLLFEFDGEIDCAAAAPRFGETYSLRDDGALDAMFQAGCQLEEMATTLGRTPLGVGWRLIDTRRPAVPPEVWHRLQQ
ncbi:hypothetical protein [Specibacter cremeus]|uniref:hypothetical protein n=1 Tax=Specibacter cremeus TaxID=1629051 RepID=UPI000F780AD7|nr:hypothetical protein [Specibacter cremeus]